MKQQNKDKVTDQEITEAFHQHNHIGKIAHQFKLPHITIFRRLKKLGLKTTSHKYYNGKGYPLQEILDGLHPYYQTLKLKNRLLKEGILQNECVKCGISQWQDKPLKLQLDHINGDSSNHSLDNLQLLCPNCHSQTDTYCGKNK